MPRLEQKINNRGFTLGELLIVVAIIVTLSALALSNLFQIQKTLRQKELDAKAETIYIAAQNQLVKLRYSGNEDQYAGEHL